MEFMQEMLIDSHDMQLVQLHEWRITKTTPCYWYRREVMGGKRQTIYLHRELMGASDGQIVDHINGNGLDCRRENLRLCGHAENMQNRKIAKSNKLGMKGVYRAGSRFRAEIKAFGLKYRLGTYGSPHEASAAYQMAATELHGAFARF